MFGVQCADRGHDALLALRQVGCAALRGRVRVVFDAAHGGSFRYGTTVPCRTEKIKQMFERRLDKFEHLCEYRNRN